VQAKPIKDDSALLPRESSAPASRLVSGRFFRALTAITWKDVSAELRSRELLTSMLVFSLLVILIFNFALDLDPATRRQSTITAGVLWVIFTFAGTLGLNRSMATEKDRGCMDGLLLAPVDRSAIYFGKALSNLVFMLVVELIVLPVYSLLYNINLFDPGLLVVILLGSLGGSAGAHTRCPAADPALSSRSASRDGCRQGQHRFPR
jgi:heme exporter protein B